MKDLYGNFKLPNGQPAAGALLSLLISQDCIASDGSGQIGRYPIEVTLDENGNIPTTTSLEGMPLQCNDEILPSGTTYFVSLHDPIFGNVYKERLSITGTSPINLALIAPALD
jgi:hypothetical protein